MSGAFLRLLEAPATRAELTDHLAKQFDLDSDRQLACYTELVLEKFRRCGLIEPVPNTATPPRSV